MRKTALITWSLVILATLTLCFCGTPAVAADGPLSGVELRAGYAYSFETGNSLAIGKASLELGTVNLLKRPFPIYADLIAVTGNSDLSVGAGLSTTLSDSKMAVTVGLAYLPHGEALCATLDVKVFSF